MKKESILLRESNLSYYGDYTSPEELFKHEALEAIVNFTIEKEVIVYAHKIRLEGTLYWNNTQATENPSYKVWVDVYYQEVPKPACKIVTYNTLANQKPCLHLNKRYGQSGCGSCWVCDDCVAAGCSNTDVIV